MKSIFAVTLAILILVNVTGCQTPDQREAWAQIFQAMGQAAQNANNQYQINQLERDDAEEKMKIWMIQNPPPTYTPPVNPYQK